MKTHTTILKRKKRVVTVWQFSYHWWKDGEPPKWRKFYKKYYTDEAALEAIKKEISDKTPGIDISIQIKDDR